MWWGRPALAEREDLHIWDRVADSDRHAVSSVVRVPRPGCHIAPVPPIVTGDVACPAASHDRRDCLESHDLGVAMPHAFDRRSFLPRGRTRAGMVALGSSSGWAGAALTNGPVATASRRPSPSAVGPSRSVSTRGGRLQSDIGPLGRGGFLYGRTVFDPLAIVTARGQVEPYLAQSITSNPDYTVFTIILRSGINFHDGTPLNARHSSSTSRSSRRRSSPDRLRQY